MPDKRPCLKPQKLSLDDSIGLLLRFCLLGVLLLQFACTGLIFQPTRQHVHTPDVLNVDYQDVYVTADDGIRLHGWKLHAAGGYNGTVIFFHGNAENISTHFANVYWMTEHGFDVYVFDYRGYGKSGGIPDLDAAIHDMETMLGYVAAQLPYDSGMIVMGHSLGGSLAIYAVAHSQYREKIKTLVTVSAFSDYRGATRDVLSTSWLTWLLRWPVSITINNDYRPLNVIADISPIPLLIMHGSQDWIIPPYHAQQLFDAAQEPKTLMLLPGDHNHFFNIADNRKQLLNYLLQELTIK